MNKWYKKFNGSALIFRKAILSTGFTLILLIIAIFGIYFVYQISTQPNFSNEKEFVIKKGETVREISENLREQGLIKSKYVFIIYLYLKKWQSSVQAGTYILTPMNIRNLAQTLVAGKVDNELNLRFIEGWTIKDMAEYLVKEKVISDSQDFLNMAKINNFSAQYDFLNQAPANSLEGFLFPDTYRVYKDSTTHDIIIKMLDNFDKKITPALLTEITAQGKNLADILIMASIIEREVPHEEDRKIVSGILWKRLDINMPLQVDATLKYVIGGQDPSLSAEELKIDSPYNTYKYRGLPPTPICNPGESALRAAIYPKKSDYWYYLSTKEGQTIFSKTLEEHNQAVEKHLKR